MLTVALLSALIWAYLILGRGRFWDVQLPPPDPEDARSVSVIAVIPARNEAADIATCVGSLLKQSLEGTLQLVLVDDHSDDGTGSIATQAAAEAGASDRLTVLAAPPLPPGWTGKLSAVAHGVAHAAALSPDYLLLTDADIAHAPDHVAMLVRRAKAGRLDLVSEMVLLRTQSWMERLLIPPFVFFFFMLYPPRWAADPARRLAGAAGGTMLVRPQALSEAGGIEAIRGRLIDDCALAQAIKDHGGRIRLDATDRAWSLRCYDTAASIWAMIARSAYSQLKLSPWLLAGTILGLALTYLSPPLFALFGHGWSRVLGLAAWIAMAWAVAPTLKLYRQNPGWGLLLPVVAVFYAAATIGSAFDHWRGRGGAWKGRVSPASPAA